MRTAVQWRWVGGAFNVAGLQETGGGELAGGYRQIAPPLSSSRRRAVNMKSPAGGTFHLITIGQFQLLIRVNIRSLAYLVAGSAFERFGKKFHKLGILSARTGGLPSRPRCPVPNVSPETQFELLIRINDLTFAQTVCAVLCRLTRD